MIAKRTIRAMRQAYRLAGGTDPIRWSYDCEDGPRSPALSDHDAGVTLVASLFRDGSVCVGVGGNRGAPEVVTIGADWGERRIAAELAKRLPGHAECAECGASAAGRREDGAWECRWCRAFRLHGVEVPAGE